MAATCAKTTPATDVRGFFAQQIYAAAMRVVPNIASRVRRTARASSPPLKGKLSIDARGEVWIRWITGTHERDTIGLGRHRRRLHGSLSAREGMGTVGHLIALSRVIDAVNTRLGKWISWLVLVVVLISATNATVRKVFDTSSNAWLELQWIIFSIVFLLCSPWTLISNEHIRIDIVNNAFSQRVRNVIDVVGHSIFLLPLTLIMIVTAYPFFMRSFELNEQSMNAGGLPQWPAKALVLIGFVLLFLQGISELIKRIAVMRGLIPDPYRGMSSHEAIEAEAERLIAEMKKD